ncbi:Intraflagellar transport protein like [Schistosoma japonicum]|nr:Intraflagellar transport protein like [Schistosoma japonicum]
MSTFLSTKLGSFSGSITKIEWHSCFPILAISSHIQNKSGEVIISTLKVKECEDLIISRPYIPTSVSWHPYRKLLIVGWSSGCITVCPFYELCYFDMNYKLEASVTTLVWSSDGYSVLISDEKGSICVFQWVENSGFVDKPVFLNIHSSVSYGLSLTVLSTNRNDSLVVFPRRNLILSDQNKNTGSVHSEVPVESNYESKLLDTSLYLVGCVDEKGFLYHYQVTLHTGVTAKEVTKMKLSSTIYNRHSIAWVGAATLAMASGDSVVRLWDVEHADNYTLAPNPSIIENSNSSIKIINVAYSETHRVLAAGLTNGMVLFWQYCTEIESLNNVSDVLYSNVMSNQSRYNFSALQSFSSTVVEKTPEANWYLQPSTFCLNKHDDELLLASKDLKYQVNLITWGDHQEKLAIAILPHQSDEGSCESQGVQTKSSVYILQRQSLNAHFYGYGCAVVQSAPRSLAMLTTISNAHVNKFIALNNLSTINKITENKKYSMCMPHDETSMNFYNSFVSKSVRITTDRSVKQDAKCSTYQKGVSLYEHEIQVENQIKALYCTQEHVAYWDGQHIFVFGHSSGHCITYLTSFICEFKFVGMHQQNIFTIEPYKLQVRNLEANFDDEIYKPEIFFDKYGCVKQLFSFTEIEGSVTLTAQCLNYMACLTDQNKIRVFDLSRREIKSTNVSNSLTKLVTCELLNQISQNTSTLNNSKAYLQEHSALLRNSNDISVNELKISWISISRSGDSIGFTVQILLNGELCSLLWPNTIDSSFKPDKINSRMTGRQTTRIVDKEEREVLKKWIPDPNVYIYHFDVDKLKFFNFFETLSNSINVIPGTSSTDLIQGRWPKHHYWDQYESRLLVVEAVPIPDDHPILISKLNLHEKVDDKPCRGNYTSGSEIDKYNIVNSRSSNKQKSNVSTSVVTMFISPDRNNTIIQGSFLMPVHYSALIGVEVPLIYFSVRCDLINRVIDEQYRRRLETIASDRRQINNTDMIPSTTTNYNVDLQLSESLLNENGKLNDNNYSSIQCKQNLLNTDKMIDDKSTQNGIHYIHRCVMQDFVGLEDADEKTREAVLNFSYHLALGEMDLAFRSMKLIKSPVVWQNMAKMCVTTCRLDVARVCLGKINNPMASKLLRESKIRERELEAHAGELALQLGMPDEAEQLFIRCNRWDLVIRLHQLLGNWSKALTTAEQHNRMLLRGIEYAYAKELESLGNIQQATEHYIKSETHCFEVPRMLKNNPELLKSFVNKHGDENIKRCWAQKLEAQGHLEEAKTYYFDSKDYLSLVRVLCCLGQESEAETICNETGDAGACYHLGHHLKLKGCIDQAIRLLIRAKAYSSAIRLCKEHDRNDHLFSLAQLGKSDDMLESAKHLEKYPDYIGKAVLLYHKAGKINQAVELAFKTREFGALQNIASSLSDEQLDPDILKQCSEFFIENNQYDRAVEILASGKQYWDAVNLCNEHYVPITEELIEKLTPTSDHFTKKENCNFLIALGELCLAQEQYYLACKKFTQAGNRLLAMQSLIKSGDTEKIIFFTNISKQKEIYIMAANYLQTLNDWRSNMSIIRNIIQFYTRGNAMESLTSFYEACAHSEIEECSNYEKALDALTEAQNVLIKLLSASNATNNQTIECRLKKRLIQIKKKITLCKELVEIQKLFSVNLTDAMQRSRTLLEKIEPADLLRPGDVYSLMIRELVIQEKYKVALTCLNEMKERIGDNNTISKYLGQEILEKIYKTLNLPSTEHDYHISNETVNEDNPIDVTVGD